MFEVPSLVALLGHGHLPTEYDIDIRERKGEDDPPSLHSQTQWWYCHFFPYLAGLIWAKKNWIFHQINDEGCVVAVSSWHGLVNVKCPTQFLSKSNDRILNISIHDSYLSIMIHDILFTKVSRHKCVVINFILWFSSPANQLWTLKH